MTVLAETISNVTRCEDFLGDNWVGIWVPDILDQEPKEINWNLRLNYILSKMNTTNKG